MLYVLLLFFLFLCLFLFCCVVVVVGVVVVGGAVVVYFCVQFIRRSRTLEIIAYLNAGMSDVHMKWCMSSIMNVCFPTQRTHTTISLNSQS